MTLMTRITRLFKADLHGILDCLEEPEAILRHAVREMREEIEADEGRLKQLEINEQVYSSRKEQLSQSRDGQEKQIDLCFAEQNEPLARAFIRKKLVISQHIKLLELDLGRIRDDKGVLLERMADQREKLNGVIEKIQSFKGYGVDDREDPTATAWEPPGYRASISDDELEMAFLQEKQRWAKKV